MPTAISPALLGFGRFKDKSGWSQHKRQDRQGLRPCSIRNHLQAFVQLFVMSEYHSHGYSWGSLNHGANADTTNSVREEDHITFLGVTTDELSIRHLSGGLGIFASGSLEAVFTYSSWNVSSLGNNVFGDASRFLQVNLSAN